MHPYIVFALLFQKFGFEHTVLNVSYQNTLNCNVTAVVQQILPAYSSDKVYCLFTVILMIFKVFSQKDTNKVRSLGVWLALRVRDRNFSNLVLKSDVQESFKRKTNDDSCSPNMYALLEVLFGSQQPSTSKQGSQHYSEKLFFHCYCSECGC